MENHFEHKYKREYDTIDNLVEAAVFYEIVQREDKDKIIAYIKDLYRDEYYYEPTDFRIDENEDEIKIRVPLTLLALKGILKQRDKEVRYIKNKYNPSENNNGDEQAKKIRLNKICELLNDIHNDIEHPQEIINFVRTQIETNGFLINGVGFIDYIKSNLLKNEALNIWGRGNSLLNFDRQDNLFELLERSKFELSKVDKNRQLKVENSEPQQVNNDSTKSEFNLPSELDTERARKYFAKAIEAKYIKVTDNGLQWVFQEGRKVALGYFVQKVFCPNNTETLPEKAINKLFGKDRIGSAISQIANARKPQKWRNEIDNLFE